jgi:hypothetical protein
MDINPYHNLNILFAQLGLPTDGESICKFIEEHKPLPPNVEIADAPWWLPAQAEFLREEMREDADWAIVIDQLSELLRSESD